MTPTERKALREKHFLWKERECNYDGDPYPCDTIKVLDYLDIVEPMQIELPWAYCDWSYEVEKFNKQEPPHEINWPGG